MTEARTVILSGNANPDLTEAVAAALGTKGAEATVSAFQDGEIRVVVRADVRGADVFVVQPLSSPVNRHLMELLLLMDAAKRAAAARVTAVVPYLAYARQERKVVEGAPVSAKVVAQMIGAAGADRVVAVDMHAAAIEGFFDVPMEHLSAGPLLARHVAGSDTPPEVVAAPDEGSVERALAFRDAVGSETRLAVLLKHRPEPDQSEVVGMVGGHAIEGRRVILVDDLVSTGGTLVKAADYLMDRGAKAVDAAIVHPVLAPGAVERLAASALRHIVTTSTVPIDVDLPSDRFSVLSVAPLLAEAVARIHGER